MTSLVVDTCVLSEFVRPRPDPVVLRWLDANFRDIVLTAPVIMELDAGAGLLSDLERRAWMTERHQRLYSRFAPERRAVFDEAAARAASRVIADARHRGRPIGVVDAQIIGIAQTLNGAVVTRDSDFADRGVAIVNPWIEN